MRKNGNWRGFSAFVLAALLCTGCGASDGNVTATGMAEDMFSENGAYDAEGGAYPESISGEAADLLQTEDVGIRDARKIIREVSLEVETREFEELVRDLETRVRELGGYVESMDTFNGSSFSDSRRMRSADMTVRIPSDKTDSFLEKVSDAGNIVRRSESTDDVTLSYVDMESRRNTLRTEQNRLLEFLDRAENVEEIITLEERLSEVRYQLESMESKLRTIDNLVDYSTIHMNISEVKDLTPEAEPTVRERISEGFLQNVGKIQKGATDFAVWLLVSIPYLIIWGAGIAVPVVLLRRHRRKKRQKLEEQLQRPAPVWQEKQPQPAPDEKNDGPEKREE
ncbi:MAG: DUF4349 domain-containing protein [Lachnospiraceae bacterium]|jgi:hypothetical protein|nr:DUF4349 domain-containing protein [Lachnospiraceae bacterium]